MPVQEIGISKTTPLPSPLPHQSIILSSIITCSQPCVWMQLNPCATWSPPSLYLYPLDIIIFLETFDSVTDPDLELNKDNPTISPSIYSK